MRPCSRTRINAVLAAAGYNFSLLLCWFEQLIRVLSSILWHALLTAQLHLTRRRKTFFTADLVWFEHGKVTQGNGRPPSLGCCSEVLLQSADVENFDRAVKAFEA